MNNMTMSRLRKLKNKAINPTENVPKDNYLEVLEELNKTLWDESIWSESDWEYAASVEGITVEELKIKNGYYK